MSRPRIRSVKDQNKLLLEIYALAKKLAVGKVRREDVDDLVHDVAAACLELLRAKAWRRRPGSLKALVRRLLKHHRANLHRNQACADDHDGEHLRARTMTTPTWMSPDPSQHEEEVHRFQLWFLARIPFRPRTAYYLVRIEGASYQDVAAQFGVSLATIHKDVVTVQKQFREELALYGITPSYSATGGRPRRSKRLHTGNRLKPRFPRPSAGVSAP